jgi:hypothetical protein
MRCHVGKLDQPATRGSPQLNAKGKNTGLEEVDKN